MNALFCALAIFLAAVVLQGLFAGYETGFVSANPIRLRHLAETEHDRRAQRLLRYLQQPDRMLTTLLIGTNLMVVTCTLVVSYGVRSLGNWLPVSCSVGVIDIVDTLVSAAIVSPICLIFSEIVPKSVFRTHPTRLSLALLSAIRFFYVLLSPIAVPMTLAIRGLLRLLGEDHHHISPLMSSIEDVRVLVDESVDQGAIEPEEQEMIHSVIDLQTTTAREIMAPRIAIQALPETATRRELVELFEHSGRTRIPIYRDTVDAIIGVVNAYAILMDETPECEDIRRFIRDVQHVPDTMKVGDLFREMKESKQYLAIVTDEYGGTDGLVTAEDIIEEIFGEIQDEFDQEESAIHKLGPGAYVMDARTTLEEVAEAVGVPIEDEDVETIGGYLMHIAGRIPVQGEAIEHGRLRITVLAGRANRISRLRVEVRQDPAPARDAGQNEKRDASS